MQLLVVHIPQTSYILLCKTTVTLIYPFPVLNNAAEISKLLNNQITTQLQCAEFFFSKHSCSL